VADVDGRLARVAFGPMDAAGTAAALAAGLRELGADAEVAVSFAHPFGFRADRVLSRRGRIAYAFRAPIRHDVLHYQFGRTWMPGMLDAWWARALRRTRVMHFHGDDCRLYGVQRALYPAQAHFGSAAHDRIVRRRLHRLAGLTHAAIVKDLELATYVYPFFERVYVSPLAVVDGAQPKPPSRRTTGTVPIVVHAPSDPRYKGTEAIERTMRALAGRRSVDFRLVTGVSHARVTAELAKADVVVDQLDAVAIGVLALEAMNLGRPVLSEYEPALLPPFQADVPVVRVTPQSLEAELDALLDDEARRRDLGDRGRAYVEWTHAPRRVAAAALAIYGHAREGPPGLWEATADGIEPLALSRSAP
jgi:hypothetical protein